MMPPRFPKTTPTLRAQAPGGWLVWLLRLSVGGASSPVKDGRIGDSLQGFASAPVCRGAESARASDCNLRH